jgi:hypothetical protein
MLLYVLKEPYPCRNRRECAELAQLFQGQLHVALQVGERQLRMLLGTTPHSITASDTTVEQIATAGFSYREVVGAVRQGKMIEWVEGVTGRPDFAHEYASTILVIKGEACSRPIHVVCGFKPQPRRGRCWDLRLLLAYDPSEAAYRGKWNKDYTRRTCFCPPEEVEEDLVGRRLDRLHTPYSSTHMVYTTDESR